VEEGQKETSGAAGRKGVASRAEEGQKETSRATEWKGVARRDSLSQEPHNCRRGKRGKTSLATWVVRAESGAENGGQMKEGQEGC